jgi:hypothetical protein
MKSISARLLMLIPTADGLQAITGDIRSTYLYAKSDLKTAVALGTTQQHTVPFTAPLDDH